MEKNPKFEYATALCVGRDSCHRALLPYGELTKLLNAAGFTTDKGTPFVGGHGMRGFAHALRDYLYNQRRLDEFAAVRRALVNDDYLRDDRLADWQVAETHAETVRRAQEEDKVKGKAA